MSVVTYRTSETGSSKYNWFPMVSYFTKPLRNGVIHCQINASTFYTPCDQIDKKTQFRMLLRLDGVTVKEVSQANQSMRGDLSVMEEK